MARFRKIVSLSALSVGLIAGCGGGDEAIQTGSTSGGTGGATASGGATGASGGTAAANVQPIAVTAEARQEAEKIFTSRCVTCHGPQGEGNGPGAANLNPKPRNYHDKDWQKSVTDEQIEKTIVYGGAAVGKSPLMAPNPDLSGKPAVVAALRERVRSFGQ